MAGRKKLAHFPHKHSARAMNRVTEIGERDFVPLA
jgi:hypothetical protein